MNDIMSLAIVGAAVSVVLEFLKSVTEGHSTAVKIASVITLSLVAGTLYSVFKDTSYWASALNILVWANAIYSLLIKQVVNWSKTT